MEEKRKPRRSHFAFRVVDLRLLVLTTLRLVAEHLGRCDNRDLEAQVHHLIGLDKQSNALYSLSLELISISQTTSTCYAHGVSSAAQHGGSCRQ